MDWAFQLDMYVIVSLMSSGSVKKVMVKLRFDNNLNLHKKAYTHSSFSLPVSILLFSSFSASLSSSPFSISLPLFLSSLSLFPFCPFLLFLCFLFSYFLAFLLSFPPFLLFLFIFYSLSLSLPLSLSLSLRLTKT